MINQKLKVLLALSITSSCNLKCFYCKNSGKSLDNSIDLNEKNLDFCINTITGRYPEKGYCTNLECEEICYILDGSEKIFVKNNEAISFNKGDIIFINKKDIYYWHGNFNLVIVCTPAWSKDQCKLIDEF